MLFPHAFGDSVATPSDGDTGVPELTSIGSLGQAESKSPAASGAGGEPLVGSVAASSTQTGSGHDTSVNVEAEAPEEDDEDDDEAQDDLGVEPEGGAAGGSGTA